MDANPMQIQDDALYLDFQSPDNFVIEVKGRFHLTVMHGQVLCFDVARPLFKQMVSVGDFDLDQPAGTGSMFPPEVQAHIQFALAKLRANEAA